MSIEGLPGRASYLGIAKASGIQAPVASDKISETNKQGFTDFLKESLANTNELQLKADSMVKDTMLGKNEDPHQALIALQKADISFRLMLSVKEKLVQAYQEVMRTQM